MSCCGKSRTSPPMVMPVVPRAGASAPSAAVRASVAVFRYDGPTQLTVFGRHTGQRYWFARTGAEVAVDLRDRASMQKVPHVKEVRLA